MDQTQTLQERFDEADQILRALRDGEIDAIVGRGPDGDRVLVLKAAEMVYQIILEKMTDGAVTLAADGLILSANKRFAVMAGTPAEHVIGSRIQDFVAADDANAVNALLTGVSRKAEIRLTPESAALMPVEAVAEELVRDGAKCLCLIVTDLSVTRNHQDIIAAGNVARSRLETAAEELERRVDERTRELRRSVVEKATLLKEVQHRVHNNLQIMASLLTVQMDCLQPDATAHRHLDAALSRVIALTIAHDINHAPDISQKIDFAEYTRRLARGLVPGSKKHRSDIKLELDLAETVFVPLDVAGPLGLVLNELIANSVRHAFRDGAGGVVRVSLAQTGDGYAELAVGDDGIGLPAGYQWGEAQSFGLKVTKILLRQVRADLSVFAGAKGLAFRIRWKLPV